MKIRLKYHFYANVQHCFIGKLHSTDFVNCMQIITMSRQYNELLIFFNGTICIKYGEAFKFSVINCFVKFSFSFVLLQCNLVLIYVVVLSIHKGIKLTILQITLRSFFLSNALWMVQESFSEIFSRSWYLCFIVDIKI